MFSATAQGLVGTSGEAHDFASGNRPAAGGQAWAWTPAEWLSATLEQQSECWRHALSVRLAETSRQAGVVMRAV